MSCIPPEALLQAVHVVVSLTEQLTFSPILGRDRICKRLWSPGIDSKVSIPPTYVAWRAGTTNRVIVPALQATLASGIDTLESIPGLLKGLKIPPLFFMLCTVCCHGCCLLLLL
jgi:hypothetical protein